MEKWVIAAKRADFNQIGQQFHIDPVIARLIRNRDVIGEDKIREYLSGTVQELPSPWLMKDMEKAVDILEKKISQKAKVRIIGDYDIDGVTSTYILMKGLARIGADVDTYIPDRVADGYGLVNFLKLLCERKILREFAGCCEEFIRRYNSAHGIAEAVVTSAVKLSDTQMEALKAKLEKLSGKKVYLVQKTDASVLGGLRVELEGVQLDGTVQSRISGISKKLNELVV